jgi:isopenicillin-N epimerase
LPDPPVDANGFAPFDLHAPVRADAWGLDPAVAMLNHGSFGACPRPVLQRQSALRQEMEAEPVRFLVREMQPLLDQSRQALAELVGCAAQDLVFVSNATAGINAVLRSLRFRPGDELLITNHGYNACSNVVRCVAQREGAAVVTVELPLRVESSEQVVAAVLARLSERTRLAVLDHITSPTAVVFPIEELIRRLDEQGVDTLVDGAHAPGMVPLDLKQLGAAYYAGNCHKWLCSPKGAGFLYARPDRQDGLQPPVISHGYNQPRPGYSRFQDAFDWQGTGDPTPWLCVGEAIRFLAGLLPGGIEALMRRNHALALAGRRLLCERLPVLPLCPEPMLGAMAALVLPERASCLLPEPATSPPLPRLGRVLLEQFGIEAPVYYWQEPSQALLRISAQAYNSLDQYVRLAEVLEALWRAA